jgi:hypothetical protein
MGCAALGQRSLFFLRRGCSCTDNIVSKPR